MNTLNFQKRLFQVQDTMMNFAMKLTMNVDDAKDLLQDTMLKALRNQDKYKEDINFKGWIITMMRNIFFNNYHRLYRIKATEEKFTYLLNQDFDFENENDSPEKTYNMNEILMIINKLDENTRIPFSMYLSGYKYKEISEQTQIPLGTIKSRIFFARKGLQLELKEFLSD